MKLMMPSKISMDNNVIANHTRSRISTSRSGLRRSISRISISPVKSNKSPNKSKVGKELSKKKQMDADHSAYNIFDEILKNDNTLPLWFLHVELLPEIPRISTRSTKCQEKIIESHRSPSRVPFSNFKVNKKSKRPNKKYNNNFRRRERKERWINKHNKDSKYFWNRYNYQSYKRRSSPVENYKYRETDYHNYECKTDCLWVDKISRRRKITEYGYNSIEKRPSAPFNSTRYIIEERINTGSYKIIDRPLNLNIKSKFQSFSCCKCF